MNKKKESDKRIPLWTTISKRASDQINIIAENRRWGRPQTARYLLEQLLDSAAAIDEKHGEGYTAEHLYINRTLCRIENRILK